MRFLTRARAVIRAVLGHTRRVARAAARPVRATVRSRVPAGAVAAGLAAVLAVGLLIGPAPSAAITNGEVVAHPTATAPWALSLWWRASATDPYGFVCTATALSAREVLTAAHCLERKGFYAVRTDAEHLGEGRTVAVEAVLSHAGYSRAMAANDVAVLRTLTPLGLPSYLPTGDAALAARIRGPKPPPLTLFGWGLDEQGRITGELRYVGVQPQGKAAAKAFGPLFQPARMLAAGRYRPRTQTYAGACNGDSGGPLVANVAGRRLVVGVTSFSAGCQLKVPTVFTSVGDYGPWLRSARARLPKLAVTDNRALPQPLSGPAVLGATGPGATATCRVQWTANATRSQIAWTLGPGPESSTATPTTVSSSFRLTAADAGRALTCQANAWSRAGAATARTTLVLGSPPSGGAPPSVTAAGSSLPPAAGDLAVCRASPYPADVTVSYSWLRVSAATPAAVAAGQVLGTGGLLPLTGDALAAAQGAWLACQATAANGWGTEVTWTAVTTR